MMIVVPVILVVMIGFSSSLDSTNFHTGHSNDHQRNDDPYDDPYVNDGSFCQAGISFGNAQICVSQKYKHNLKMAPKPLSNQIFIVLSNVQITEIADKLSQMTILMDLEVNWNDSRLKLVRDNIPIFLDKEDQNIIWSPQFRIGTDLISLHKQTDDLFILFQYLNQTSVRKISYITATIKCKMQFYNFPFDKHDCTFEFEDQINETSIKNITIQASKLSDETNNYIITSYDVYKTSNDTPKFGIHFSFERTTDGINSVALNYHLICGILVLVATISFLMDPKDTNRGVLLATVLLVLATFFTVAHGEASGVGFTALTTYILICMVFICISVFYYGILLFIMRKTSKEAGVDIIFNGTVIKRKFTLYNVVYFSLPYCGQGP